MSASPSLNLAVRRRFRWAGRWTRFHVWGRLKSCPFHAILPHVPKEGLLATLGCGFGLLEFLAAQDSPARRVLGADLAENKIRVARRASDQEPKLPVEFEHADLFEVLAQRQEPPSAIAIVDVLCVIPVEEHPKLARKAFDALPAGGVFIVKEMGHRPRWKYFWNVLQETLACRVLRFTLSPDSYTNFLTREEWRQVLEDIGFETPHFEALDKGYLHPHLLVVATKPK